MESQPKGNEHLLSADIEETTMAETDAERWERQYAEIAQLAGGLAHEIRNPLSTIRLNVELLGETLAEHDDPESRRMLTKVDRIESECRRVDAIIGAFLQFAKAGRVDSSPHDLSELVRQFVQFFEPEAESSSVEIRSHLAAGLPLVNLDEALMRQVFGNLARNAIEAMPDGGVLEVTTVRDGDTVVLEVIDTGCGMSQSQKEKMFDVFYSSGKVGGSGLGLPTVAKIVEAHGGKLACDTEPGKGTRFRVLLPIPNGSTETE